MLALFLAAAVELQADPAHSTASFTAKHLMVTTVRGEFSKLSSTLSWDKDDPAKSAITVTIDAASIDTHNEKRDAHLKSADFFDVQRCPEITFKSNKISKAVGAGKYKVSGDLTMRCVTKPATFDAEFEGKGVKAPWGATVYAASASGKVKRSEWGLNWNKMLEGGGVVLSDEIGLDVELEYTASPTAAKKEAQVESKK
ncbi:MAG: YceI family protein [Deltaproteobacteria bacterium]|nr:MAG: YceI family protein [Deltaproteobacteria bacterium]